MLIKVLYTLGIGNFSENVVWLIQLPRLYNIYKGMGIVSSFQTILDNIFLPLFEVTIDPGSLPQQTGYSGMRSMDDYRAGRANVSNPLLSSTKRLKNEIGFSSGSLSSSGTLPRINEGKVMEMKSARDDGGFGSHSWDDSDILSDSFLKELGVENDQNKLSSLINPSENQNDVGRIHAPLRLFII